MASAQQVTRPARWFHSEDLAPAVAREVLHRQRQPVDRLRQSPVNELVAELDAGRIVPVEAEADPAVM